MSSQNNEVPLHVEEDEKHLLLDHSYDGIQELNHPLPRWWNFLFYVAIYFGVAYWLFYSVLDAPNLRDEFKKEMGVIQKIKLDYEKLTGAFKPEVFAEWDKPETLARAQQVFEDNCLACHAENGRGDIGPNLTDNYWLLTKGTPETNYKIVYYGSEENGMPAWGEVLSTDEIYLALVYVKSIHNTFHPEGKEPQGEKIDD